MDVLLFLLGVVIFLVGLAVSIGLHELGHLIPAKKFGVKVGQYMIGFGPTVWSKRWRGTEYGVKAIPLGGYISMAGMFPPKKNGGASRPSTTALFDVVMQEAEPEPERASLADEARAASLETLGDDHRGAFYRLPVWQRIIVMLGGPFMNLVLGTVLFTIVLVGIGLPQSTMTLETVSACLKSTTDTSTECTDADPVAPAAEAGLQPGDTILAIDGQQVDVWTQAIAMIQAHPEETIDLQIERDGATLDVEITPALQENYLRDSAGDLVLDDAGEPVIAEVGYIGVGTTSELTSQPIGEVPVYVGEQLASIVDILANLPQKLYGVGVSLFSGSERELDSPVSIVGVGRIVGEVTAQQDAPVITRTQTVLGMLGSLNFALFVFNLIPLLPLDGGHVAGAIVEAIRRGIAKLRGKPDPGPIDTAKLIPVTFVVVGLLGAMSVFLIVADLVNPVQVL